MKLLPEITGAKINSTTETSKPLILERGVSGNSQKTSLGPGPSSASSSRENVTRGHPKRIPKAKSGLTARF